MRSQNGAQCQWKKMYLIALQLQDPVDPINQYTIQENLPAKSQGLLENSLSHIDAEAHDLLALDRLRPNESKPQKKFS